MQDKVLRSYAEMENVLDRTRREAENSKKFAIQVWAFNFCLCPDIPFFVLINSLFNFM